MIARFVHWKNEKREIRRLLIKKIFILGEKMQ